MIVQTKLGTVILLYKGKVLKYTVGKEMVP